MLEKIKKIYCYYVSHITFILITVFIVLLFFIVTSTKMYTENEYKNYLISKTYDAENIIATSLAINLKYGIFDIINLGTNIATDNEVYEISKRIYIDENDNKDKLKLEETLKNYVHGSKWVIGITIYSKESIVYQYDRIQKNNVKWKENMDYNLADTYENIYSKKSDIPKYYISFMPTIFPGEKDLRLMHISFPILQTLNDEKDILVVTVTFNTEIIKQYLSKASNNSILMDKEGVILYSEDIKWIGKKHDEYLLSLGSEKVTSIRKNIDIEDIMLNIDIDETKLIEGVNSIYSEAFLLFIVIVVVLLLTLFFIIQKLIIKPIHMLICKVNKVEINKELELIKIRGDNEVWQLAKSFNEMQLSLKKSYQDIDKEYNDKVKALQKQREAEMKALESQINAHFICNTINVINYDAMEAGNSKVSLLLKKLSNILRYTFNNQKELVPFFQEIAWIEQYLYLQQCRFENLFDFKIDFPDMLLEWPCGKLTMQPFVENAIIHGFKNMESGGLIKIVARIHSENIIKVVIEDNGCGMDEYREKIVRNAINNPYDKHTEGIGISNVVTRIRNYYKEEVKIEMENKKGVGCKFIFYFPRTKLL